MDRLNVVASLTQGAEAFGAAFIVVGAARHGLVHEVVARIAHRLERDPHIPLVVVTNLRVEPSHA